MPTHDLAGPLDVLHRGVDDFVEVAFIRHATEVCIELAVRVSTDERQRV